MEGNDASPGLNRRALAELFQVTIIGWLGLYTILLFFFSPAYVVSNLLMSTYFLSCNARFWKTAKLIGALKWRCVCVCVYVCMYVCMYVC